MRSFEKGDLVLKLKQKGHQKLESPWEGPFIVTEVIPWARIELKKSQQDAWKATHGTLHNCADFMFKVSSNLSAQVLWA